MIRELLDSEFDSLYAALGPNIRPDIEEEDMLSVIGRMKNGVIFSLDPSWSNMEERLRVPAPGWEVAPKRMEVNLIVCGEKGTLMCDCFGPNTYHNGAPNDRYTVNYTYFDEWVGLIDEFVDNIRLHRLPKINLYRHRETVRVMNSVYESIATATPSSSDMKTTGGHGKVNVSDHNKADLDNSSKVDVSGHGKADFDNHGKVDISGHGKVDVLTERLAQALRSGEYGAAGSRFITVREARVAPQALARERLRGHVKTVRASAGAGCTASITT